MSNNLVPKTGFELLAGFAICALVFIIGNNSSWNVFADSCTTSCENAVTPTVDLSTVIANAGTSYMNEVSDAYSNYNNAANQAYTTFIATEKSEPNKAENQFDTAMSIAKINLRDSLLKAEIEYEAVISQMSPSGDA